MACAKCSSKAHETEGHDRSHTKGAKATDNQELQEVHKKKNELAGKMKHRAMGAVKNLESLRRKKTHERLD